MANIANLAPLTPFVSALIVRYLVLRRNDGAMIEAIRDESGDIAAPQVFMYSRGIIKIIFASAIFLPLVLLLLPDSVVQDARPLFDFSAFVFAGLLLLFWAYLYRYKIVVSRSQIKYGAFKISSIDLSCVTSIKYHWVNNGINLKLFCKSKRIGYFEGGVENFDGFAKAVRQRLPNEAQAETIGRASF